MSRDLDEQLEELGAPYRAVVDRLTSAYRPMAPALAIAPARWRRARHLVAAGVVAAFGLVAVWLAGAQVGGAASRSAAGGVHVVSSAEYSLAYLRTDAAVREMIRTQRPDGSWKNDFLTRQNAAALRLCDSHEAQVAYRKAMRNLRTRGLL